MAAIDTLSPCGQRVRRYDHDRYLTCLFAPDDRREALFAIFAFNHEVAKIREVVREPILGQIRLQWWRESIAALYAGEVRRHEVIEPLAEAVRRFHLTHGHFDRVIDGRERDLETGEVATLAELERYGEETTAPLLLLGLEALGVRDAAAAEAARQVGIAWALVGLLRAVPHHARQRRLFLPREVVEEAGVDRGRLFELKPQPELATAVKAVAARASEVLVQARDLAAEVPQAAVPALLTATLAESHLRALRKAHYDVFDARVQQPHPLLRQIRLMWNAAIGSY